MTRKPLHIEIAMPSGPAHYWKAMCAAGAKGFTIRAIALASEGVAYDTVKRYVWWLEKQGYVLRIGKRQDGYATQNVYVVKKRQAKAPIERPDPQRRPLTTRDAMWNAIRTLQQFTARELCKVAATEERPVSLRAAELYVQRLVQAGVLQVVAPPSRASGKSASGAPQGATAGVYRLLRAANTGPQAPRVCNAGFVFDPNSSRVLGAAIVTEARR